MSSTSHDPGSVEQRLRDDHRALMEEARIPSAGAVYWRASIRARGEAARKAEQPLTVAQGFAAAAVAGVGAALGGVAWRSFTGFESSAHGYFMAVAFGVAALVVLSPLALVVLGGRNQSARQSAVDSRQSAVTVGSHRRQ